MDIYIYISILSNSNYKLKFFVNYSQVNTFTGLYICNILYVGFNFKIYFYKKLFFGGYI